MQVALVHDYLNQYGGAERVLEALHELFPVAPVYTSIFDPATMPAAYQHWDIRTSFMQRLPAWRTQFRRYVPLYPTAFEQFDLRAYDLIISSSSAFAKGIIPRPGALHICYCHTPMRFAWRTGDYVAREQISGLQARLLPFLLNYLRMWDAVSTNRVDLFVANSREVAGRIARYYRRPAMVIPPPVDLPPYEPRQPEDFYLAGGRLIPYKRLELAIEAFNHLRLPLKIFGDGRDRARLERMAGPHIEFLGWVDEATRLDLFARCRAFIFPGEEDFGITPLEVLAVGRPVIAYAAGGALETLVEGVTGRFFYQPTAAALAAAVALSRTDPVDSLTLRHHAEQFSRERFLTAMRSFLDEALAAQRAGRLLEFEQSLYRQSVAAG
ncbi:glycosyltransferase [uncultured Chloroflexus sp.]|uniref:glycosyltransferase n=1 Tax=uncultured Chloroflexus sp. TaxID=214040 RepID=UPI00261C9BF0|nr:glycosyltransferase [uncultured Chloroflexus sp.]